MLILTSSDVAPLRERLIKLGSKNTCSITGEVDQEVTEELDQL